MTEPAFDTLEAARRLQAADIRAEKADAIVEVVNQSTRQLVTVERFDAAVDRLDTAIAGLHARIDSVHSELSARIDSLHTKIDSVHSELNTRIDSVHSDLRTRIDSVGSKLQASFSRSLLIAVGILIATIALTATIFGILLTNGAFGTVTIGAP